MIGLTNDYVEKLGLRLVVNFLGTFPCNIQPDVEGLKSFSAVFNESKHDEAGSHFVCVYATEEKVYYFDSMGLDLENDYIKMFVFSCGRSVATKNVQIQSIDSNMCGFFCICFLLYMSLGLRFENFFNCFSRDLKLNDIIVIDFIKKMIEIKA
jgi:hypothetical protein